jgi:hypothetical protein
MEGAGFTLYATKDLVDGTRFEYNGDRDEILAQLFISLEKSTACEHTI